MTESVAEAALQALLARAPRPEGPCGRPTKAGHPCKAERPRRPEPNPLAWIPASCTMHATPDERAAREAAFSASESAQRAAMLAEPVKCWSWPVTQEHMDRAAAVRACPDLEEAKVLASHLLDDWQAERCAICGGRRSHLVEDHDHTTGLVRGWLCQSCNASEGFAAASESRYVRYRAKNPATMLGITIRYSGYGWINGRPVWPSARYVAGDSN